MLDAEARLCRSKLATAARYGDPEQVADAQREYWTVRLAQQISNGLAKAPPLTEGQLERLAGIIGAAPRATARH